jgi:hypothetical protein
MRGEWDTENASGQTNQSVARLQCAECATVSSSYAWGWRGYRMDDPEIGEPPALAFYCPVCAEREFGSS